MNKEHFRPYFINNNNEHRKHATKNKFSWSCNLLRVRKMSKYYRGTLPIQTCIQLNSKKSNSKRNFHKDTERMAKVLIIASDLLFTYNIQISKMKPGWKGFEPFLIICYELQNYSTRTQNVIPHRFPEFKKVIQSIIMISFIRTYKGNCLFLYNKMKGMGTVSWTGEVLLET